MFARSIALAVCLLATASLAAQTTVRNDLNADGRSDLLWQMPATSACFAQQNGFLASPSQVFEPGSRHWVLAATGDVNRDATADLIWQNKVSGQVYLTFMNDLLARPDLSRLIWTEPDTDWQIVLATDFNNDGTADLLWHHASTGQVKLQFLGADGSVLAGSRIITTEPDLAWRPVAAGSLAKPAGKDLIWRNQATGAVHLMPIGFDGSVSPARRTIYTEPDLGWGIVAAEDFNLDGNLDLLWWHRPTGKLYLLLLDAEHEVIRQDAGHGVSGPIWTEPNVADWTPVATGDYNGDGWPDILWYDYATGQVYQMLMDSQHPGQVNRVASHFWVTNTGPLLPVAGLNSIALTPPTLATDPALTPWRRAPGAPPKLWISTGDSYTVAASLLGPAHSQDLLWEAWKADGSALLEASPLVGSSLRCASDQEFLLKVSSRSDPSRAATRWVGSVAAPAGFTLQAYPTSIQTSQLSTLTFSFGPGETGVLTNDIDPTFRRTFTASGTLEVSPVASTNYLLTVSNAAGRTGECSQEIRVVSCCGGIDTTITILGASKGYVTAGSVYLAHGPGWPGVTYTWSIQGGFLTGGQGTNQVTLVVGPPGTLTLALRADWAGAWNTGQTGTITIVPAPVKPVAMTVQDELGIPQPSNLTALRPGQSASVNARPGMTYEWTVSNGTLGNSSSGVTIGGHNTITFTPGPSGEVTLVVWEENLAGTRSPALTSTRGIRP